MKKILSVILCVLFFVGCVSPFVCAVSINDGKAVLCSQFKDGEYEDLTDYVYFEPENANENTVKYPLVVWLHGNSSGNEKRKQLYAYDFSNWASDEYQSRFADTLGAYLLLPRSYAPDRSWYDYMCSNLKGLIDDFIAQRPGKIDTSRIYILGYSSGGNMVYSMLTAYPKYFAAAIPMGSIAQPTSAAMSGWQDLSLWIFCSDNDFYLSANTASSTVTFDYLAASTNRPSDIRMTNFSKTVWADGSRSDDIKMNHYVWDSVIYDMHMKDGSPYMYATTRDAAGNRITFENTDGGLIEWLCRQKRPEEVQKKGFFDKLADFFRSILNFFKRIFS